ncbi:hypothetical protein [Streptomyces flavalbus]|uniref:Uncharacterized protein n=1 Tax=Streptomyces flavalbus TaxID=2665155 RepID=A0ABW2WM19_9ACTN
MEFTGDRCFLGDPAGVHVLLLEEGVAQIKDGEESAREAVGRLL